MKTPPPLSAELEALLAPHREVLPLAPSLEARSIARAAAAAECAGAAAGRAPARLRWVFAVAAVAVLGFAAGAYAARAWIAPPAPGAGGRVTRLASPPASEPRATPSVAVAPEPEAAAPPAPPAMLRVRRSVGKTSATVVPTNAELQLLRQARQDVTRGAFADALAVIAEHVRRFRNGSLVEEREALRVKSLAGLGRDQEAQRAAARFHARFPHSVFLSTFERMKGADR